MGGLGNTERGGIYPFGAHNLALHYDVLMKPFTTETRYVSSRKSCREAWRRSSSPRRCFTRPISPGLTHFVAGRFMPFGAGPACSWTRFQSRSRISRFRVMKAEPT